MVEFYQNTTPAYVLAIVLLAAIYWLLPSKIRQHFLFGLSILFGFLYAPLNFLIILGLAAFTYFFAKWSINKNKFWLIIPIVVLLLNLSFFKYLHSFEIFNFEQHLSSLLIPFLGVSYFTFRMIHFVVEVNRQKIKADSFSKYLGYVIFFPTFSAGPIHRYDNFSAQKPIFCMKDFAAGFERILIGLFKKIVLADSLAVFTADLSNINEISTERTWLAVYLLSLQVYFDFSGYSDIAIGMAKLFGYKVMENFNWPYLKHNLSIFWKSWHISLTDWIKHYVFIPLGGSRVATWRTFLNSMIVMLTVGLWHGASLNFIVWGALHGFGLIILRIYRLIKPLEKGTPLKWWQKTWGALLTFNFVTLTWVFFFYDLSLSIEILKKMFFLA